MPAAHRRAAGSIILAAALFSTGGAAIKWAHFTGWQIAGLRAGIAGLTLLLLSREARRGWGWRPLLVGAAYAVTCICFVLATRLTTSANAIFIQSTSPLYVLLLSPWLLGERVTRSDLVSMVPIVLGLTLFFLGNQRPLATAPDPVAGNLIAAVSGLTFALLVIGLRWLGRAEAGRGATPITAAAMGNLLACLVALPLALPIGSHHAGDWAVLGYLGVFQIGVAYFLVARALTRLPALEASMLLMLEPALNPVWAWLVHGELPGSLAILGGVLVLGGTLGRAWLAERLEGARMGGGGLAPRGSDS